MKGWIGALLLTIGLSVIFVPTVRQLWSPTELVYEAPKAEVSEKIVKEKQMLKQEKVETPMASIQKDWSIMDILDKIIGWITSLAGTCMMLLSYADKRKAGKKNGRHKRHEAS